MCVCSELTLAKALSLSLSSLSLSFSHSRPAPSSIAPVGMTQQESQACSSLWLLPRCWAPTQGSLPPASPPCGTQRVNLPDSSHQGRGLPRLRPLLSNSVALRRGAGQDSWPRLTPFLPSPPRS